MRENASRQPWVVLFFIFLLGLMIALPRVAYFPFSRTIVEFKPGTGGGDDMHYLLMVNSLLFEGDLQVQDDYRRVREGGLDAGYLAQGRFFDHHSLLVDPFTKEHRYFSAVFSGARYVDCVGAACRSYLEKWNVFSHPDAVVEIAAHPAGFPLIVAGLLSLTFPRLEQTEARMGFLIAFFSWLGACLVYGIARSLGFARMDALLSVILLVFASPWLPYSRSFFSEPLAGVLLLAGLWAMCSRRPALAGVACAAAFAVKLPLALVGLGWILECLWTRRFREAAILGLVFSLGAGAFCFFNYWQAGTFLIGGHIDPASVWGPFRPFRTFFDFQYGLLLFVPWSIVGLAAIVRAFLKKETDPADSVLRMMFFPVLFYGILLAFHRPLGGSCYGCRYWLPFLPWLALAAGIYLAKASRVVKLATLYLGLLGAAVALPAAIAYPHAWNQPPHVPLFWLLGMGKF